MNAWLDSSPIGLSSEVLSYMGFRHSLQDRGLDYHGSAGLLFHPQDHFGRHQRCHAAGAGDSTIGCLSSRAEDQCFGTGAINYRALVLLDAQPFVLCLVDGQRGAGTQVGRAVSWAAEPADAAGPAALLVRIGHVRPAHI